MNTKNRIHYFIKSSFPLFILLISFFPVQAQNISPVTWKAPWKAQWIALPNTIPAAAGNEKAGVFKFRKSFELSLKPSTFIIHVSADNRYKLYVNSHLVSTGPVRGDLYYWNYETLNIAPYLHEGKNTIGALVWDMGALKPEAQISFTTGLILQGATPAEEIINTNNSWKAIQDSSYRFMKNRVHGYYVAGPVEVVDMKKNIRGWEADNFDDNAWRNAVAIAPGYTKETAIDWPGWMLVPSSLPQMEHTVQRINHTRKSAGVDVPAGFPKSRSTITILPNTTATILLDQGFLTNAYPTLIFSNGKDADIVLSYAEALYLPDTNGKLPDTLSVTRRFVTSGKGNRNEVEGKFVIGTKDSILSDGTHNQNFTPLWWRTFRYLQLKITTKEEPLEINDIYGTFTGYPFQYNAAFKSNDSTIQEILEIGWRTARLCAHETYMDCPYYEQLQYAGDTRIQSLVSIFNSGDDRLMRNAITQLDHSRIAEGITLSRWPSGTPQQIPPFSLWYIGMLHDYWWYRPDTDFVKNKLIGMRQILWWFSKYQSKDVTLRDVPYWNYTDHLEDKGWVRGRAPIGKDGASVILDLQLCWALQLAAQLEEKLGLPDFAKEYNKHALQLKEAIKKKYWDNKKLLLADTEEKDLFSQHANSLAILANVVIGKEAKALAKKILIDTTLAPASIYFKYYVHRALIKAGLGNDYMSWLDVWRENIKAGLTTWAEMSDVNNTRSDCHAWGCSPNIEFYRTTLGIDSDAAGFAKIKIEPHLGTLKKVSGEIPHPKGKVGVQYILTGEQLEATIDLPLKTSGTFIWKGKKYLLKEGKNLFQL